VLSPQRVTDARSAAHAERRAGMMERIHAAALEQFSLRGLHGTSTQDIAAAAGISKQQLHYYIESKEALYEQILRGTMQHWAHIGLNTDEDHADPAASLARLVQRKLAFTFEHPLVSRLFAGEILSGGHAIRGIWRAGQASVDSAAEVIRGWVEAGKIAPVDPLHLMFHIWALTQHYADYEAQVRFFARCPEDEPLDRERIREEITALVLRGVGLAYPRRAAKARSRRAATKE
jgi:TetR/AcrR family transcriptional regulator